MSIKSVFKVKKTKKSGAPAANKKKNNDVALDNAPARALFNEQGICVYADDSFNKLDKSGQLEGVVLFDFLMIEDDNGADHDAFTIESAPFASRRISPGIHNVSYFDMSNASRDKSLNYPKALHFEKIDAQNGQSFLLLSFVDGQENAQTASGISLKASNINGAESALAKWLGDLGQADRKESSADDILSEDETLSANDIHTFLNMSHELMAIIDADGKFRDINQTVQRNLGYNAKQLGAMNFIDLVHPEDRAHVRTILKSILNEHDLASDEAPQISDNNAVVFFETRVVARDGETRWTEWKVQNNGRSLYTVGRDMTDAKKHEDELIRHQTQLSEAQEIGHMGHWRWEIGRNDISWSDELFRIFGVSADKFTPSLESVNKLLRRSDVARMMQAFQRAMIEKNNYEMEFSIQRPDGEERSLILQGRCEENDNGDVSCLFGVIQDVTERIHYERELRYAKEAAERAYAAKSQFLANMSHELRTPLNAIIGFSEMMQRQLLGPIGTEKYLDYIKGIRESGEHLLDLISDILDMSKIEAGKYELDVEELHIAKIVRLAVHMMEGKAHDAQVSIDLAIDDEEVQLDGDRRAILQILLNLLSNSVKFTNEGGKITVNCTQVENSIHVRVDDSGMGIPAHKLADITNPFEQAAAHDTRDHEGSGLGLAITKELIELHGGELTISSELGVGTSVTFTLPLTQKTGKS